MADSKPSTHYQTDSADGLPASTMQAIDDIFLPTLANLSLKQPKVLVVFSGGNAVGKTTLARKIGHELGGVVLENDAMKECITKLYPTISYDDRNKMTWQYSMSLYSRLDQLTENGLVVRDGIIDWYYDRILPRFKGYDLFVVAYNLSRTKNIELITKRGDKPTVSAEHLLTLLDDHDIHTARFRKQHMPDIVLDDKTVFNHGYVIDTLREKLRQKPLP